MRVRRMQNGGDVESLLKMLESRRVPQRATSSAPAESTKRNIAPPTRARLLDADSPAVRPRPTISQRSVDYEDPASLLQMISSPTQTLGALNRMAVAGDVRRPTAAELDAFGQRPMDLPTMFTPIGDAAEVERALGAGRYGAALGTAALSFTPIPARSVRFLRENVPMVFRSADFSEIADDVLMDLSAVPDAPVGSGLNDPFDIENLFFSQSQAAERVAQLDPLQRSDFFDDFEELAMGLDLDQPKLADQIRKASQALEESAGKIAADMEGVKFPDKVFRTGGDRPLEFSLDADVGMGRMEYTGYDLKDKSSGITYDSVAEYKRAVGRQPDIAASADIVSNKNRMDLDGKRSYADYAFNIKVPSDAPATTALRLMRKLLNSVPNGKIIEAGGSLSADSYPFVMSGLKRGKAELAKSVRVPSGVSYKPLNAMGENYTSLPKMLNIPKKDAMQLFETTKVNVYEGISVRPEVLKQQLWEKHKGAINAALKDYGLPPAKWDNASKDVLMPHPYLRKLEDYRKGGRMAIKKKNNKSFGIAR